MSRSHQQRCEGDGCLVGLGGLVVAGGDAAPLLEAVEAPLDDVASLVDLLVEGRRTSAMAAASEPVANVSDRSRMVCGMFRRRSQVRMAFEL